MKGRLTLIVGDTIALLFFAWLGRASHGKAGLLGIVETGAALLAGMDGGWLGPGGLSSRSSRVNAGSPGHHGAGVGGWHPAGPGDTGRLAAAGNSAQFCCRHHAHDTGHPRPVARGVGILAGTARPALRIEEKKT